MDATTSREKVLKSIRNALISKLDNPYQDVDFESPVFAEISDSPEIAFAQELIKKTLDLQLLDTYLDHNSIAFQVLVCYVQSCRYVAGE